MVFPKLLPDRPEPELLFRLTLRLLLRLKASGRRVRRNFVFLPPFPFGRPEKLVDRRVPALKSFNRFVRRVDFADSPSHYLQDLDLLRVLWAVRFRVSFLSYAQG